MAFSFGKRLKMAGSAALVLMGSRKLKFGGSMVKLYGGPSMAGMAIFAGFALIILFINKGVMHIRMAINTLDSNIAKCPTIGLFMTGKTRRCFMRPL